MDFKPTILEYYDNVTSVCSFYRGRGIWSELERQGHVNLVLSSWNEDWSIIRRCHIAYFQRPVSKKCLQQIMMCKDLGLKIWIDLDDWIECPEEHPIYQEYSKIFEIKSFEKSLLLADIITVSTDNLHNLLSNKFEHIKIKLHTIPNAINDYIFSQRPISHNKIIVWRGGENHLYDIKPYTDQINEVLQVYPDWTFYALGSEIPDLKSLSNYYCLQNLNIHQYFAFMVRVQPSVVIVPLKTNVFNMAKSNIAWLESTMAGAVTVMPHWTDYNISFQYDETDSFREAFINSLNYEYSRENVYKKSVSSIKDSFLLSQINKQRLHILKLLI